MSTAAMTSDDPAAQIVHAHIDQSKLQHDIAGYNDHLITDAAKADKDEHTISLKDSFFIHKKAIIWSMLLSSALIMEGYDVVVVRLLGARPLDLD